MNMGILAPLLTAGFILLLFIIAILLLFKAFYIKVPQGTALIINDLSSTPKVRFTGGLVWPVIHKKEFMKISLLTLYIDRRGKEGLICQDNMRADITVAFYLRVNETAADVLKVAKSLGADRASDKDAVNELFNAKFSEALKTVGKQTEFVKLFENRQQFRDRIIEVIGQDLNGYALEDVAIDYIEQTPKEALDPANILDAEGIRKITELTAAQNIVTNEISRNEELAITKKNVETREAMLSLERQKADAEARQAREIASIRAREEAETLKVQEEERLKAEQARITTQELVEVREENRQREVEVAQQNRQRAVAIEIEKVSRARELEIVAREREVELQRIEKEKALETEKATIANVIRERVMVEKTVAQEEERIKEVREVSAADRDRQVVVLQAKAEAEESLVKQIKQAEADEEASRHEAVKITVLAQAELDAATQQAEAKKRLAEGIQAERAAPGLADAKVREVSAAALEKEGLAQARVEQEQGLAQARVLEEKLLAQARGEQQVGSTQAKVTQDVGQAEAGVTREKLLAEAEGLVKKFAALNQLGDTARAHEEFRMQLEKTFEQAMASIAASKAIAHDQAQTMAAALSNANIDIVGGEGAFFDKFAGGLSMGKFLDGLTSKSPLVGDVLQRLGGGAKVAEMLAQAQQTNSAAIEPAALPADGNPSSQA